ncbi:hypothetical protein P4T60_06785 [Bacillus atrophaeus]|uniref:hypothetical protein n=1 Tax=Bacillus atrophaeus TaxID=1452 RepID=UPI002E1C209A|nr:hypothetical protein [Bacillus atrophaeus]MED1131284.1 hypothetical protein [Bacillus atrophaeus]
MTTISVFFDNNSGLHVKVAFGHEDDNCGVGAKGWRIVGWFFVERFRRVQLWEHSAKNKGFLYYAEVPNTNKIWGGTDTFNRIPLSDFNRCWNAPLGQV